VDGARDPRRGPGAPLNGSEPPFRVAFVAGVTPDKWVRRWTERRPEPLETFLVEVAEQTLVLQDGRADMSLVRLPVDTTGLHLVPLYVEEPVVVVSRDHVVSAFESIDVAELADEHRWSLDEVSAKDAVEAVAGGTGVVVLPLSVARLHHRRDVVAVPVEGVEGSQVGLAWRVDRDDELTQELVGVVRGRTARSSRGGQRPDDERKARPDPKQRPSSGKRRRRR
jgi:DNA-binding transcriptional LysR family regulator